MKGTTKTKAEKRPLAQTCLSGVKNHIVGTHLGLLARKARATSYLWSANRENVGTCANDQLAEMLVTRLCERSFVDVGAHIGSMIAEVQAHCPKARITAFEPIPEKAERLRKRFKGVDVIACALSDFDGETSFYVCPAETGYSSLARTDHTTREIRVPVKRLDELVRDADTIKVDVEGAELGVLKGSENLKTRPLFMFESGPEDVLGYTKADLWGWFQQHDYAVYLPNRLAHEAPPMRLETFVDSHYYPRHATNYFGVPLEKVEKVRAKARQILKF